MIDGYVLERGKITPVAYVLQSLDNKKINKERKEIFYCRYITLCL
jgi:hypothetical protein